MVGFTEGAGEGRCEGCVDDATVGRGDSSSTKKEIVFLSTISPDSPFFLYAVAVISYLPGIHSSPKGLVLYSFGQRSLQGTLPKTVNGMAFSFRFRFVGPRSSRPMLCTLHPFVFASMLKSQSLRKKMVPSWMIPMGTLSSAFQRTNSNDSHLAATADAQPSNNNKMDIENINTSKNEGSASLHPIYIPIMVMPIKVDTLKWFIAAISRFVSCNEYNNTRVCHDSSTGSPVKSFHLSYRRDLTYICSLL